MRINLTHQQAFTIAREFADVIFTATIERRLTRIAILENRKRHTIADLAEVRRAISSIDDHWDRKNFIGHVKWHLDRRFAKNSTPRKWQDYADQVDKVRTAAEAEKRIHVW